MWQVQTAEELFTRLYILYHSHRLTGDVGRIFFRTSFPTKCTRYFPRIGTGHEVVFVRSPLVIAATLILSFYGTVSGWTLEYVWLSISNSFHGQSAEDINSIFTNFISHPYKALLWHIGFMFLTGAIIMGGVQKGIERYPN